MMKKFKEKLLRQFKTLWHEKNECIGGMEVSLSKAKPNCLIFFNGEEDCG